MTDSIPSAQTGDVSPATLHLRVLATSDVHGHVLPFDYFTNAENRPHGLARVATLVRRARVEAGEENCLLLDNGDFLQGTALSDLTPQPGQGWRGQHPVLRAMNKMGYDAATLGNHEFNFGLDWLRGALREAEFPLTCANAVTRRGVTPLEDTTFVPPYIVLTRRVRDAAGTAHTLRIGLIGLTPPQITTWDRAHLTDRLTARDMLDCARAWVPVIRAKGADLVIALAHTGIGTDADPARPEERMQENAARALAQIPGIDAIIAGHSHRTFPGADHAAIPGADNDRGTLCDVPCVLPGFGGSHLGQLDIDVTRREGRWQVTSHHARLYPTEGVAPCLRLVRSLGRAHAHTVKLADRVLARTSQPIHSYLSLVRNGLATQIVNDAQSAALQNALRQTPYADLPVLSASPAFKTGGLGGPENFTDIPAGALKMRNIVDLYGFPNTLCGLLVTGTDLRDWLERSAICFNRIIPGRPGQRLLDRDMPGHSFDVIDGLGYRIDLTRPARFDAAGQVVAPQANRIRDLTYKGRPVRDNDRFVIATNSYRAWGGGPFRAFAMHALVHCGERPVRDLIVDHVKGQGVLTKRPRDTWGFMPLPGTRVEIETGPGLRAYPDDITALGAIDLGIGQSGFLRLRIPLGRCNNRAALANPVLGAYLMSREVGAGKHLANPVRSGRKQP